MLLNKWNYQTHKYDKVEIPDCYNCKTYSNNMKELVHCPQAINKKCEELKWK